MYSNSNIHWMHVNCTLHVARVKSSTATRMVRTNGFFARQDHAEQYSTNHYLPIRNQRERDSSPCSSPFKQTKQHFNPPNIGRVARLTSPMLIHQAPSLTLGNFLAPDIPQPIRVLIRERIVKSRFRARDPRCMVRPFASVGLFVANNQPEFHSINISSITYTHSIGK